MHFTHSKTLKDASESVAPVTAMCWSNDNSRFAIATADSKYILLYDDQGNLRDKVPTKPADPKNPKPYRIIGLAFSPDNIRLAVGQTDRMVFIYGLGATWGEKKSITNKFLNSAPVTTVAWPRVDEVAFGMADGKVKYGSCSSNRATRLYAGEQAVISMCTSSDGVLTGHDNGDIIRYLNGSENAAKLCKHSCAPRALAWTKYGILAAGGDGRVVIYDNKGSPLKRFGMLYLMTSSCIDHSKDKFDVIYSCASASPSGQLIGLGAYNSFRLYSMSGAWKEDVQIKIDNYLAVTTMSFKNDGSKLALGSATGSVDWYELSARRIKFDNQIDVTFVSQSSVVVRALGVDHAVQTDQNREISDVDLYAGRFLVMQTPVSLLFIDTTTGKRSEVPWLNVTGGSGRRYIFDNPDIALVVHAGEVSVIPLGSSAVAAVFRSEFTQSQLMSLKMFNKDIRVAFLMDARTVQIMDVSRGVVIATAQATAPVDWLEMNELGTQVMFRDVRRQLYLLTIDKGMSSVLKQYVSYAQWIPGSALSALCQSKDQLCVWYDTTDVQSVTTFPIANNGDVIEIVREPRPDRGFTTYVSVQEPFNNTAKYKLDDALISFGTYLAKRDYASIVPLLESVDVGSDAMWNSLLKVAIEDGQWPIVERCAAALGNVALQHYLFDVGELQFNVGDDHYLVQARLALLQGQVKRAETLLLNNGEADLAIELYQILHRWDLAISVAERCSHPDVDKLKKTYYAWLVQSRQEVKAADYRLSENDPVGAVPLYLAGGKPDRAMDVLTKYNITTPELWKKTRDVFIQGNIFSQAGACDERLGDYDAAMNHYTQGNAYKQAVDLARSRKPASVTDIEKQWGEYLVSIHHEESAVNHFIEARQYIRAAQVCVDANQLDQAAQILSGIADSSAGNSDALKPLYIKVAGYLDESGEYERAEQMYIKGGQPEKCVEMFTRAGKWKEAQRIANVHLQDTDNTELYAAQAAKLEAQGRHAEAETLYITCHNVSAVVSMYMRKGLYNDVIRVTATHQNEKLTEVHGIVARKYESEGKFADAETHYLQSDGYKSVLSMYRSRDRWADALRVAKQFGGPEVAGEVGYALSKAEAKQWPLLTKYNVVDQTIDYACAHHMFDEAYKLANSLMRSKLLDILLSNASYLASQGQFDDAEAMFIKARKPQSAVEMYIGRRDWQNALRVAETHDQSMTEGVLLSQASSLVSTDLRMAESVFMKARRPDLVIDMYKKYNRWNDALRVCKDSLPHRLPELHREYEETVASAPKSKAEVMERARLWEQQHEWDRAIDQYLSVHADSADDDGDMLEEIWEHAVSLSMSYSSKRVKEIVCEVANRLLGIRRPAAAARLLQSIDMVDEALDIYIQEGMWEQGKLMCSKVAPSLMPKFETAHQQYLIGTGQADGLVQTGNYEAAISLYMSKNDFDNVLPIVQSKMPDLYDSYFVRALNYYVDVGDVPRAMRMLETSKPPAVDSAMFVYHSLACSILSISLVSGDPALLADRKYLDILISILKDVVMTTPRTDPMGALGDGIEGETWTETMDRVLNLLYYVKLSMVCGWNSPGPTVELGAQALVSSLRYLWGGEAPIDKMLYASGTACRVAGRLSDAFVLLNKYLDITEAMEANTDALSEPFEFVDMPESVPLPRHQYVPDDKREEIRDWALQVSMDQKVDQEFTRRQCNNCKANIQSSTLYCPACRTSYQPCVITEHHVHHVNVCPTNQTGISSCISSSAAPGAVCYVCSSSLCTATPQSADM